MDTAERNEKIRALHAQGVSFRALGRKFGLSAAQCQRISKRAEPDDEDAIEAAYIAVLVKELFNPDGGLNRESRLYRLLFFVRDDESIRDESTW